MMKADKNKQSLYFSREMLEELRAGSVVALDVLPALDGELVLGIVQRAGRTQVPAAARAFDFVRQHFATLER